MAALAVPKFVRLKQEKQTALSVECIQRKTLTQKRRRCQSESSATPSRFSAPQLWGAWALSRSGLVKRSEDASKIDQLEQSPFHGRSVVLGQVWIASPCEEATQLLLRRLSLRFSILCTIRSPLATVAAARLAFQVLPLLSIGHRVHFNEGLKK